MDDAQGISLLPLLEGASDDLDLVGYGESIESHVTFGTSILRYVREGRWKYIHKIEPELFDLMMDPGENSNLAADHPEVVERLRARLTELIETAPSKPDDVRAAIDATTAAQLEAMGYIAAAPIDAFDDEVALLELKGDDPTSKVPEMAMLADATGFRKAQDFDEAAKRFREILERNPESMPVLALLDDVLVRSGRDDERFELLPRIIALAPQRPDAYVELAQITFKRGDAAGAEKLLAQALEIDPCLVSPRATLAHLVGERGDRTGQLRILKKGVDHCPFSDGLHNSYAYLLATSPDEADRDGPEALRIAKRVTDGMGPTAARFPGYARIRLRGGWRLRERGPRPEAGTALDRGNRRRRADRKCSRSPRTFRGRAPTARARVRRLSETVERFLQKLARAALFILSGRGGILCNMPPGRTRFLHRVTCAFVAAFGVFACGGEAERSSRPLNLILIVVDTLRADHLGYHGYSQATSPRLDSLAEDSVVFLRHTGHASRTGPSVATLFTGLHSRSHGVVNPLSHVDAKGTLAPSRLTLAEILSEENYRCAGFTANLNVSERFGFSQGFRVLRALEREERPICSTAKLWPGSRS